MFTRNIREAFISFQGSFSYFESFWRWLHGNIKIPFPIFYGGFPVKLTTFVGPPILFDESMDDESLAQLVAQRLEDLIKAHQKIPGNIFCALKDRVTGSSGI